MSIEVNSRTAPSSTLTVFWALFFFLVFALVLVILFRGTGATTEVEDSRAAARISKREKLAKEDAEKLSGLGWVDKAKGIAHIPLEDAKNLFVESSKVSPKPVSASAVKISPVLPRQAPFDPNAAEPAPAAMPSAPQGADTLHFEAPAAPAPRPSASVSGVTSQLIVSASLSAGALNEVTTTSEINQ